MTIQNLADSILQQSLLSGQQKQKDDQQKFENIRNVSNTVGQALGVIGQTVQAKRENPEALVPKELQTSADRFDLARTLGLDKKLTYSNGQPIGLDFFKVERLKQELANKDLPLSERVQKSRELRQTRRKLNTVLPSETELFSQFQALSDLEKEKLRMSKEDLDKLKADVLAQKKLDLDVVQKQKSVYKNNIGETADTAFNTFRQNLVSGSSDVISGAGGVLNQSFEKAVSTITPDSTKNFINGFLNSPIQVANAIATDNRKNADGKPVLSEEEKAVKLAQLVLANAGLANPNLVADSVISAYSDEIWNKANPNPKNFINQEFYDQAKGNFKNIISQVVNQNVGPNFKENIVTKSSDVLQSIVNQAEKFKVPITSFFRLKELDNPDSVIKNTKIGLLKLQVAKDLSGPNKDQIVAEATKKKSGKYWDFLNLWGMANGYTSMEQVVADFSKSNPVKDADVSSAGFFAGKESGKKTTTQQSSNPKTTTQQSSNPKTTTQQSSNPKTTTQQAPKPTATNQQSPKPTTQAPSPELFKKFDVPEPTRAEKRQQRNQKRKEEKLKKETQDLFKK